MDNDNDGYKGADGGTTGGGGDWETIGDGNSEWTIDGSDSSRMAGGGDGGGFDRGDGWLCGGIWNFVC